MQHPQEMETLEFQDISELVRLLSFSSLTLQRNKGEARFMAVAIRATA